MPGDNLSVLEAEENMSEQRTIEQRLPRSGIEQRLQDAYVRGLAPPPDFAWTALEELGRQRKQIGRMRAALDLAHEAIASDETVIRGVNVLHAILDALRESPT